MRKDLFLLPGATRDDPAVAAWFAAQPAALGYVNAFTSHVNLGFFLGAELDDPADLLEGAGKRMRHIRLLPDAPPDAVAVQRLIEDAFTDLRRRIEAVGSEEA